jgi:hypothetical protein
MRPARGSRGRSVRQNFRGKQFPMKDNGPSGTRVVTHRGEGSGQHFLEEAAKRKPGKESLGRAPRLSQPRRSAFGYGFAARGKVGNLMRGGRLGRVKPILLRIKTLRTPRVETASRSPASSRGKAHWPILRLAEEGRNPWRGQSPGEQRAGCRPNNPASGGGSAIGLRPWSRAALTG